MFRSVYSVSLCCCVYCLCINVHWMTATGISGHFSSTLTEVFPWVFLSCKENARVNSQRRGTARTFQIVFLFIVMYVPFSVFCVLLMRKCVLYCCHRVSTNVYCTAATGFQQMCTVLLPPGVNKCVLYCCHRVSTNVYCTAAIGCQQMCAALLPSGVNPIAVKNKQNKAWH
jgi:hypothetical protein